VPTIKRKRFIDLQNNKEPTYVVRFLGKQKNASTLQKNTLAYVCTVVFIKKGCPGWGGDPGSFNFINFLIPSLYR
jgi:hypothetical protein